MSNRSNRSNGRQRNNIFSKINFGSFLSSGKASFNGFAGAESILENRDSTLQRYDEGNGNSSDVYVDLFTEPFLLECYERLEEVLVSSSQIEVKYKGSDEGLGDVATDFIKQELIDTGLLEELTSNLLISYITGIAATELNYSVTDEGKLTVKSLTVIDSERIVYSANAQTGKLTPRLTTRLHSLNGVEFEEEKIVIHSYSSIPMYSPYGLGLGSQLKSLVEFKDELLKMWVRVVEKFTTPIVIGRIPEVACEEEVDMFLRDLKKMSENARFILPPDFDLEVVDISASGTDKLVQPFLDYIDRQISGLVLGESITGQELSNGAQARDIVASKITLRKAKSLAKRIDKTLNSSIVDWLVKTNFPTLKGKVIVSHDFEDKKDLKEMADILISLKQLNYAVDPDWIEETFNIPQKPEDDRKRLGSSFDV